MVIEETYQWRIQGRGQGGGAPPLFLDQTEAQRAEKNFFGGCPPPYLRVWMTAPPVSGSPTAYQLINKIAICALAIKEVSL